MTIKDSLEIFRTLKYYCIFKQQLNITSSKFFYEAVKLCKFLKDTFYKFSISNCISIWNAQCISKPRLLPICHPIILKSCSAIIRSEVKVLGLTWSSLFTLNNKTGTEYTVWFCSIIIISSLNHLQDLTPAHVRPVPVLMHTGRWVTEPHSLLQGAAGYGAPGKFLLCAHSTFCPGQSTGAQPSYWYIKRA